jgi:type IV pilus assembly protein PilO
MLEKLNAQSTPIKLVIALVIAALLGGLGYYFVSMPLEAENKTKKTQLDAKLAENATLKQYESKLGDLDRQIVQLKAQMEFQKQIVPDEKSADNFIILLQEQASNANINIRKIESKAVANKEFYTETPYALQIDGPYYGTLSFFEKLATQTRIINVDGIQIKGFGGRTGASQYPIGPNDSITVNATVKTFFSKEVAAMTPAPAAPVKK